MKAKNFFLFALLVGVGCAIRKNLETPFVNPENKPRVEQGGDGDPTHGTDFCKPQPDGTFDGKGEVMRTGFDSDSGAGWAIGGGCILRPIREVWAVLNNLEVLKFEAVNDFEAHHIAGAKAEFTHAYEITYFKSTIGGDIEWTIQWYHGVGGGTFDAPESININFQRTSGTSNISVWGGGIVLTKVNDDVTSFSMRTDFKARQSNGANESSARDVVDEVLGDARNGAPDWKRLDNTAPNSEARNPDIAHAAPAPKVDPCKPDGRLKIACFVSDPKELAEVFDLKAGAKICAIENGEKTDMSIDGEEGLKDFPAKLTLDKETSWFVVGGKTPKEGGTLQFDMWGELKGNATLYFKYDAKLEGGTHLEGSAELEKCGVVH